MIYAAVSRLAAQNARPEQVAELERIQKHFRSSVAADNVEEKVFYNNQFHSMIGEMSGSVFLQPSLRRLLIDHARIGQTFYRARNKRMLKDLQTASRHHDAMIEAFRNHDEDAAADLAREHWELSRRQIELFVTPESLEIPLGTR